MFTKIMFGVSAASIIGLLVVFGLLLSAQKKLGAATDAIDQAAATNANLIVVKRRVESNRDELLKQLEKERVRAEVAQKEKEAADERLRATTKDIERRVRDAQLTNTESVCADSVVPDSIWMWSSSNP